MKIGITVGSGVEFINFFQAVIEEKVEIVRFSAEYAHELSLVLFPGGADISPGIYREQNIGKSFTNPLRDIHELRVLKIVKDLKIPHIGICRGHQFLNAAYGGKLIQDLEVYHQRYHTILLGNPQKEKDILDVNSTHHQAVKITPFNILAVAFDGTIEMAADDGILTMQFHPEMFMPEFLRREISSLIYKYVLK